VAAWATAGGTVIPIPGASAVLAAVAGSGIAGPRWSFEGFLPRSGRERRERIARIAADERGTVVYEAPTRVAATLRDLAAACGPERPAAICRELTKLHEEFVRAPLGELARRARDGELTIRGEFAIVVGEQPGGMPETAETAATAEDALAVARAEVEGLVARGVSRGDAARQVAIATGIPRRQLYGAPADR
jgi:16S rRNA (cytidine1402-2'-O)-methyltransferase